MTVAQTEGEVVFVTQCVMVRDMAYDDLERMYEVTIWPHDELDDIEVDCPALIAALDFIGPWAHAALPVDQVTDMATGTISFVLLHT